MSRLLGHAIAAAALVLVMAGCGDDTGDAGDAGDAGDVDSTSDAPTIPGEGGPTWAPVVPEQPVDPDAVRTTYAPVVDAAVEATGDATWSDATVTTEAFNDLCVVKVERVGDGGSTPSDPDQLRETIDAAVSGQGFDDLDVASDPGGALTLVAHDDAEALFEWRSKTETTIAVRVATSASECEG